MDVGLGDRVVLVTGGSSGIGRAIALVFAAEAARVALTYHSDREAGEATARRVDGLAVPMGLADPASIDAAVEAFRRELDRGYFAMVSTGPGHAEQVRDLPVDAETVILRLPISGG